ncbi:tyrosine-type recombinase/integrase [Limnoglobus roseus]|uniref:Site-specific integrase n=1 Tax=Limnoglobus roseus TaxID=2598579 RepID=A0A5C1AI67_9BACT|nr:tyrosine-type recombinase/integrase [Limnoglobus roseus]QEL18345.1 site-specific integrase [Limnoglobus roseus]
MSRSNGPEPFFRADRGIWYVQVHGKQHNLGRDEAEARKRWHALMAAPPPSTSDHPEDPLLATVVDEFLTWTQQHREARTYTWYLNYLQEFVESLPQAATFTVSRLKPFHVEKWVSAAKERWGASCQHGAIRSVQRCFRWAEKQGYIQLSPVRHIEKPTPQRREKVITTDEYKTILAHYKEIDPFRDMLVFAWETGARAQEIRIIEKRHYREDKKRIEIPPAEAKTKRWRIIFLNDAANAIAQKLVKGRPTGEIFRNEDGQPWTTFSTSCRFARLEKKLKERYCLTLFRHAWCQRMLEIQPQRPAVRLVRRGDSTRPC